ncbi:class I SAM-dependent methyltransferase [filamentous cyanobacterium LEGE 11480]|uniref:Class I SAM-dependent methyltransferase n=2 Tax=Romeriopsis TaxID=2992131 RepID=A0A928Z4P7_9CYAN|nr:class I SAM-dependent methyltransferase [Romeriopsis navalis LEGE 11480]
MWNQRYSSDEFVYGTEPNSFLAQHAELLTGPVLSLAEGEGRNAVCLASLGLDVLGVDGSAVGLAKAQQLAASRNLTIRTEVVDLATYIPPEDTFGSVVSIWAHLPSMVRQRLHGLVERSLKPGGMILLEAYSKAQLTRNTGGPKDVDMLVSAIEIEQAFPNYDIILSQEIERDVSEGKFHTGLASVVQFIARKPA